LSSTRFDLSLPGPPVSRDARFSVANRDLVEGHRQMLSVNANLLAAGANP
jgi:hypothetical protein